MNRRARKILTSGMFYGIILTLAVAGADFLGFLDPLERWFYDRRARTCQFFTPPPTDRLVHLDIDDAALDAIGRWAWPRARLAEMVDEIHLAGPKAMAWDVLFLEPQEARYEPDRDGKLQKIEDDHLFAASLNRLGCVLLPISLRPASQQMPTPLQKAIRAAVNQNLELPENDVREMLRRQGVEPHALEHNFVDNFLTVRRQVMFGRIMTELRKQPRTRTELRKILLPNAERNMQTPVLRLLDEQYARATAQLALVRFTRPVPQGIGSLLEPDPDSILTPIPAFTSAVRATGYVDYIEERDGRVRRMPLFAEYQRRMYPQLAVALALTMLDTDIDHIQFAEHQITIPRPHGSPIVVPLYTYHSDALNRPIPLTFDIPWFGAPDGGWLNMYDKVGSPHISFNAVWDVCLTRRKLRRNNEQADDALRFLYKAFAPEKFDPFEKHPLPPDDAQARIELCRAALADYGPFIEEAEKTNLAEIKDPQDRAVTERLAAQGPALRNMIEETPRLQSQLQSQRADLRKRLAGRAILVGWAATAQAADQKSTSIHAACPGVVIHGTIFNALMTGRVWRRVPAWVDLVVLLATGAVAFHLVGRLSPMPAVVCTLLLISMFALINGVLVFDWGTYIMKMAPPIVTAGVMCAGITVSRFVAEAAQHSRIRQRFQSYKDPSLVQYYYEHPELMRMEGEVREMTVCFTDLVGFTALTEQFKERAVPLLGRYTSRMVPIIRKHRGLLVSFMGDGLMFAYGAPRPNPNHAADAVTTIMEMFPALDDFNRELVAEGYPALKIRAGVSTGEVVVGDTGGDDACDYTCLGLVTNFGARLESANKALGTTSLLSARTVALLNGQFLVRQIACLRVAGRQQGEMVYEPLGRVESATAEQKRLTEMTGEMVGHFLAARFDACLDAAQKLDREFGLSRLTVLYCEACLHHLSHPTAEFTGQIVLDQK